MNLFRNFAFILCLGTAIPATKFIAQECELPMAVVLMEQTEQVPDGASDVLNNALTRMAVANGISTNLQTAQFVLAARIDVLDKSIVAGPPTKISYNLGITLYIADVYNKQKFASAYIEVNGVGNNETKAFTNAFRQVSSKNYNVRQLLSTGKKKILNYYDTQYINILKEANRKADMREYEEAIALATSIPTCSKGGDKAKTEGLKFYNLYRDHYNLQILNKARGIWSANQNAEAAREVADLLFEIDPEAACYKEALNLCKEIKSQVRSDLDLEMREKYRDQVKLEEHRIASMRAIGVAWGNGQKPKTTNINWLK